MPGVKRGRGLGFDTYGLSSTISGSQCSLGSGGWVWDEVVVEVVVVGSDRGSEVDADGSGGGGGGGGGGEEKLGCKGLWEEEEEE